MEHIFLKFFLLCRKTALLGTSFALIQSKIRLIKNINKYHLTCIQIDGFLLTL